MGAEEIARRVGCTGRTVRKWKARFRADPRLEVLDDQPRSGRPAGVPVSVRCELVQFACERPDGITTSLRETWTYSALAVEFLHERGHEHVRARKRGAVITVESGPRKDPVRHARFRRDTVHLWLLEMPSHTERWQPTGIRGQLSELLTALVDNFPWTLTPIVPENPERT